MPWRESRSPYRVFVSEIMLQQTSVPMVTPRYRAFLREFPSFKALAASGVGDVIRAWKGLGYNRRALALLQSARIVSSVHRGRLPRSIDELVELPGVGAATAAAVIVYAFNIPAAFIETNVRRVFLHFFFPGEEKVPDSRILPLVERTMDRENPREWFYALMDYGTFLAGRGEGRVPPAERRAADALRRSSRYRRQGDFEGSHRQLRGRVLKLMLEMKRAGLEDISAALGGDARLEKALQQLVAEGFLGLRAGLYSFR
jgi:A/G-specific adenine glycosylase